MKEMTSDNPEKRRRASAIRAEIDRLHLVEAIIEESPLELSHREKLLVLAIALERCSLWRQSIAIHAQWWEIEQHG